MRIQNDELSLRFCSSGNALIKSLTLELFAMVFISASFDYVPAIFFI